MQAAALAIVLDFVNTYEVETDEEELGSAVQLGDWLSERSLLVEDEALSEADVEAALELREALRTLLLANNGVARADDAAEALNRAVERAGLAPRFSQHDAALEPTAPGVAGALGRIPALVFGAMADGDWSRLKACRNTECEWAFYDRSKNRSRTWCSMAVCGNRAKTAAYRLRHAR
jgi:predicted RNA-binding Zn ribbon-like protein